MYNKYRKLYIMKIQILNMQRKRKYIIDKKYRHHQRIAFYRHLLVHPLKIMLSDFSYCEIEILSS